MPDFGSFRGFSEKLAQGQTPTQLGSIGSFVFGFDADALAFFNRVTTAGGSLSDTEKTAVNTLVVQMKADGTWSLMKAIYPMVGASAAACSRNLKSDDFNGSFSTGWTFASTGVNGNGTSAFMNTNYIQNNDTSVSTNDFHQSVYINNFVSGAAIQGVFDPPAGECLIIPLRSGNLTMNSNNLTDVNVANAISLGHFVCARYQLNSLQYYISGVSKLSTTNTPSSVKSSLNYYLGLLNNNGTANFGSASRIAFSTIGQGLTPTQVSNFYTAVQAFQTTLSRQV